MTDDELRDRERKAAGLPLGKWRCGSCGRIFDEVYTAEWTKEMQQAEHDRLFPGMPLESAGLCCDDCFKEIESETMGFKLPSIENHQDN